MAKGKRGGIEEVYGRKVDEGLILRGKTIWMDFQLLGETRRRSTKTKDIDEAEEIVERERTAIRKEKLLGVKPDISLVDGFELYYEAKVAHKSKNFQIGERNLFRRTMGTLKSRATGKYWTPLPVQTWGEIDDDVLTAHYETRRREQSMYKNPKKAACVSMMNDEIYMIRRVIAYLHRKKKNVPSMASIDIDLDEKDNVRMRMPSTKEVKLILSHLPEQHKEFFHVTCLTGVRNGELCNAKWEDVLNDDDELGDEFLAWDFKNDKIIRKVMGNTLRGILQKRLDARIDDTPWIFPMPTNNMRPRNTDIQWLKTAIRKTSTKVETKVIDGKEVEVRSGGLNDPDVVNKTVNNGEELCLHHFRIYYCYQLWRSGKFSTLEDVALNTGHDDARTLLRYLKSHLNPTAGTASDVMEEELEDVA